MKDIRPVCRRCRKKLNFKDRHGNIRLPNKEEIWNYQNGFPNDKQICQDCLSPEEMEYIEKALQRFEESQQELHKI